MPFSDNNDCAWTLLHIVLHKLGGRIEITREDAESADLDSWINIDDTETPDMIVLTISKEPLADRDADARS